MCSGLGNDPQQNDLLWEKEICDKCLDELEAFFEVGGDVEPHPPEPVEPDPDVPTDPENPDEGGGENPNPGDGGGENPDAGEGVPGFPSSHILLLSCLHLLYLLNGRNLALVYDVVEALTAEPELDDLAVIAAAISAYAVSIENFRSVYWGYDIYVIAENAPPIFSPVIVTARWLLFHQAGARTPPCLEEVL